MTERGLLDPKLDLVFKRLFAESPDLLVDLINAVRISEPPIVALEILNPQVMPEDITKKLVVLDILARDATGRVLNVEMQTRQHVGLPTRMVFYLARLLGRQLESGEDYYKVQPVIGITLMDFDLFPQAEQAVWDFELRDRQFPDIVLDRSLQLHLVEMPKADRLTSQTHPALAKWVSWFKHWQEDTIMQQIQHPAIQKAHQHLHALSRDDRAWIQALERERTLSLEATFKAEVERGKTEVERGKTEVEKGKAEVERGKAEIEREKAEIEREKAEIEREKAEAEREKAKAVAKAVAKGEVKGQAKGRIAERADILRRLLRVKFGQLPASVDQQLQHASPSELEHWTERVLFADTLDQVFARQTQ